MLGFKLIHVSKNEPGTSLTNPDLTDILQKLYKYIEPL